MKLTYIYHSGFVIESDAFTIIIDYYKDTSGDRFNGLIHDYFLKRPGKLYVLSSHVHPDHFNPDILDWRKSRPDIQYIFSKDILDAGKTKITDAIFIDKLETFEDEFIYIKAFGSTDIGISFFIKAEDKQIFHAGDLNNWHWNEESTPEEAEACEVNFLNELEILAKFTSSLDVVLFPVDPRLGRDYMRGAEQFIERIKVVVFAPMHFGETYAKANAFKTIAESKGCKFIGWSNKGECIDLNNIDL